jgi:hypothetical protein
MVDEGVALESNQNKVTPPVVVEGQGVENRQHKGADVLESHHLGMKVSDGGSFVLCAGIVIFGVINRPITIGASRGDAVIGGGDSPFESGSVGTLGVENGEGHTDTSLGVSSRTCGSRSGVLLVGLLLGHSSLLALSLCNSCVRRRFMNHGRSSDRE